MAHPGGRPTKYTDEMPPKLLKAMYDGLSVQRFCRQERICKETFYTWTREHAEFLDAFKMGQGDCEAFWEEYGASNMENKNLNTNLYKYYMANRFGWSENKTPANDPPKNNQEQFNEELKALVAKYQRDI